MKQTLSTLLFIAALLFSVTAKSQDTKYSVSVGPEFLLPVGATAEVNGPSYGASLQATYQIMPKLQLTLSGAYTTITIAKLYKELWEPWYNVSFEDAVFYPVKGGARFFLVRQFYVAGEAGVSIPKGRAGDMSFAYTGGLGGAFNFSKKSALDVSARYETWALNVNSKSTFLGVRAAYAFRF